MSRLFIALLLMILISNCEKKSIKQEEAESEQNQKKLNNTIALTADIKKGRKVYFANVFHVIIIIPKSREALVRKYMECQ